MKELDLKIIIIVNIRITTVMRLSLEGFVYKAVSLALVACLVAVSIVNNLSFVGLVKFNQIVTGLDRGAKADVHQIQAAWSELPSILRDYFRCSEAQSRGELSLASATLVHSDALLANGDSSPERYMLARAADQRLRCSPLDGNAWLRKASSHGADVNPSEAATLLSKSCSLAPAEKWLIDYRLPFIRYTFEKAPDAGHKCRDRDLPNLMKYYDPTAIARFYEESSRSFREVLRGEWAILEYSRKIAIARAVDRTGLILDRSFWLEHVARDRP